jgi:hypothetical protein
MPRLLLYFSLRGSRCCQPEIVRIPFKQKNEWKTYWGVGVGGVHHPVIVYVEGGVSAMSNDTFTVNRPIDMFSRNFERSVTRPLHQSEAGVELAMIETIFDNYLAQVSLL